MLFVFVSFLGLFGLGLTRELPEPKLVHLGSGLIELSYEDVPGIEFKEIAYGTDKDLEDAKDGPFYQADSGLAVLPPKPISKRAHRVIMRDDFSTGSISSANWGYEISMYGGHNWEIQVYTNDPLNCFQSNGNLYLKPTLTTTKFTQPNYLTTGVMDVAHIWGSCTNGAHYGCKREGKYGTLPPIMSCKLKSKKTITYGKVEVRAKIPKGDWIWPGNLRAVDGSGHNHGVNQVSSTLHWGPSAGQNRFSMTHGDKDNAALWSSDFHVYSLDWTAQHIIISVDNHPVLTVNTPSNSFWGKGGFHGTNPWSSGGKNAPFDRAFYLILNVAIGGTNGFFPDGWSYNTPKPWSNNSPTEPADFWSKRSSWLPTWHGNDVAMVVDYVQMTQY